VRYQKVARAVSALYGEPPVSIFVKNYAESKQIRARVDLDALGLLGATYIPACPLIRPSVSCPVFPGMRDAKVHHVNAVFRVHMMFCGLQIAVDHTGGVCGFDARQTCAMIRTVLRRKFFLFTEHGAKVAAFHELHGDELEPLLVPESKMRMTFRCVTVASQDQFLFEAEEDFRIAGEVARFSLRARGVRVPCRAP